MIWLHPRPTLFPYSTLFRSREDVLTRVPNRLSFTEQLLVEVSTAAGRRTAITVGLLQIHGLAYVNERSEEHTSELQSRLHLVCRLLLEKKKLFDELAGQLLR